MGAMRIRRLQTIEDVRWVAPVLSPADLRVASSAADYLEIARQQAEQIILDAHESAEALRSELRDAFIAEKSDEFRGFIASCRQTLSTMESHLQSYARDVAHASIQRLDVLLGSDEKLEAALRQVVTGLMPGLDVCLVVPPGCRDHAMQCVQQQVDPGLLAGLRLTVQESDKVRSDEVSLKTSDGAQISCSFEDMLSKLLVCVE